MQFTKPTLDIAGLVKLLTDKGLLIPNTRKAKHYLRYLGYYRLRSYWLFFFSSTTQTFQPGTSFDQVLDLYLFDRKLRVLIMDEIERIEVAIRTVINHELCLKYGSHWFLNPTIFKHSANCIYSEFVHSIERDTRDSKERFIQDYFSTYTDPFLPPGWMVVECLSFGKWSRVFKSLKERSDKKVISDHFGIAPELFESWVHCLTYLRNLCAHHSRVWNRKMTIKPMNGKQYSRYLLPQDTFYAYAAIIQVFLKVISKPKHLRSGPEWGKNLARLFAKHPGVPLADMGFPAHWQTEPLWQ